MASVLAWLVLLHAPTPFQKFEGLLLDARLTLSAPSLQKSDEIVLVLIDSESIDQLAYTHPIDRAFLGKLLLRIQAAQPKAIGLTLRLDQPTELHKDAELAQVMGSLSVPFFASGDLEPDRATLVKKGFLESYLPPGTASDVLPEPDSDGVVRHYSANPGALVWRLAGVEPKSDLNPLVRLVRTANLWQGPFARYQAHLLDEVQPDWLKDKTVIVGIDSPRRDQVKTAWVTWVGLGKGQMTLAEFHAHALSNVFANQLLYPVWWLWQVPLLMFFSTVAIFLGLSSLSSRLKVGAAFALSMVWVLFAQWLFAYGWVIGFASGWGVVLTSLLIGLVWLNKNRWPQIRFVRQMLSHYIAPELRFNMLRRPGSLHTVDSAKEFALLSVHWSLAENETNLSRVHLEFKRLCTLIADHGGFVFSSQSGQLMAVFNAPVELTHYKSRITTCAIRLIGLFGDFRFLSKPRIQFLAGQGYVGPCKDVRPGGYWVSGSVYNNLLKLQNSHKEIEATLLTTDDFLEELRDPNWEFVEVGVVDGQPLFTVRLAAAHRRK